MTGLFAELPLLFADAAAKGPQPQGSLLNTMLSVVAVGLLFYLLMIRPSQQQEKKRRERLNALKKNDRVLTTAGIYGTVVSVDAEADKVVLRVDDAVKLTFSRASVAQVVDAGASADGKEKDKEKEKASKPA